MHTATHPTMGGLSAHNTPGTTHHGVTTGRTLPNRPHPAPREDFEPHVSAKGTGYVSAKLDKSRNANFTPPGYGGLPKTTTTPNQPIVSGDGGTGEIGDEMNEDAVAPGGGGLTTGTPADIVEVVNPGGIGGFPHDSQAREATNAGGDLISTIHNTTNIEFPAQFVAPPQSTTTESNYDVESLKTWLGREHHIANVTTTPYQLSFSQSVLADVAKGKLDYFTYFKSSMQLIVRWNAPKTTFGSFVLAFAHGSQPPDTTIDSYNFTPHKVWVDLQGSVATINAPWFYPAAYAMLDEEWTVGNFILQSISNQTVAENAWTPSFAIYVSFHDVSLLTPSAGISMQGSFLTLPLDITASSMEIANSVKESKLLDQQLADEKIYGDQLRAATTTIGGGNANAYQSRGESVLRTFSEGINLARADGADPAIPITRVTAPITKFDDPFEVETWDQLVAIPSFHTIAIGKVSLFTNHSWLELFRKTVAASRCDFLVKIHARATVFHSGRVRLVYVPEANMTVSTLNPVSSWGPSILWDIQDDRTISFEVPYGSITEYNSYPAFQLVQEIPFASSLSSVSAPVFDMELICVRLRSVGFGTPSPWGLNEWLPTPLRYISAAPQMFNVTGFYHDRHTSEGDALQTLASYARRPCYAVEDGGNRWFTGSGYVRTTQLDFIGDNAEHGTFNSFIGDVSKHMAGWRGSVKVSMWGSGPRPAPQFRVQLHYGPYILTRTDYSGVVISEGSFLEVVIPYFTPFQFYGCAMSGDFTTPQLNIFTFLDGQSPPDPGYTFALSVTFLADFQMLCPTVAWNPV